MTLDSRGAAIPKRMVVVLVLVSLLLQLLLHDDKPWGQHCGTRILAQAFHPPFATCATRKSKSTTAKTELFCICVDCQWVTSCKAYHFVETKHEQPHMSDEPTFLPREGSPTINVNIRTEPRRPEAGIGRMWKDQIQDDEKDEEPRRDAGYYEETGTIEAVKTNTTTTIEYDIVKCADFALDKGCWVRNMPDEIKRVNPDFVPT